MPVTREHTFIDLTLDDEEKMKKHGIQELAPRDYWRGVMETKHSKGHPQIISNKGISPYNPRSEVNIQVSRVQGRTQKRSVPPLNHSQSNYNSNKRGKVEEPVTVKLGSPDYDLEFIEVAPFVQGSSSGPQKRKTPRRKGPDIIELTSDEDIVTPQRTLPNKKQRTDPKDLPADPINFDSEDYDNTHAGYDLQNADIWVPLRPNEGRIQREDLDSGMPAISDIAEGLGSLDLLEKPTSRRPPDISLPFCSRIYAPRPPGFIPPWDSLRLSENYKPRRRSRPVELDGARMLRPNLDVAVDLHRLRLTARFKECPGSVVRIDQKGGWAAICSASIGGDVDIADEQLDPYNREGSLITWHDGQSRILMGHQTIKDGTTSKHYAVDDVEFDPCSSSFVTSGKDCSVRVWSRLDHERHYRGGYKLCRFDDVPIGLAFKPGTSILAVGERKVHIFQNISQQSNKTTLSLFPEGTENKVGCFRWGCGPTSGNLFASSEWAGVEDEDSPPLVHQGYHTAFDVTTGSKLYRFDATEEGDAMCIDLTGSTLMVSTSPSFDGLIRLYDIQRKDRKARSQIPVGAFPPGKQGEITEAAFSPDGVYLALPRNDNCTHVYDSRMLGKGVLMDYKHRGESKITPGGKSYGVQKVQWVESSTLRLGLVSAGEDGCVRLWDPLQASENKNNGVVLAEVNSDIGWFSLGDRFKGEQQLIVGDCTGEVSIFDRFREDFYC